MRPLLSFAVAAIVVAGASAPQASNPARTPPPSPAGSFETSVKPFLANHCSLCHNPRLKTAGLDVAALSTPDSVARNPDTWDSVLLKIRSREMPPEGAAKPSDAAVLGATAWIERELDRVDRLATPDPGRVTVRRLNRAEYNNTVRDLLGVDLRPADDFPQDDAGYGFDNIADVLSVPPVLMERYMTAAERLTRTALFGVGPMKPTMTRLQPAARRIIEATTIPATYDTEGLTLPNAAHLTYRFPVEGEYAIRVVGGGVRPRGSSPIQIALWIDGRRVATEALDPADGASFSEERQDLAGKSVVFRTRVSAGDHWIAAAIPRLYEGLPASYEGPAPSTQTLPPLVFTPPADADPERIERRRKAFEARMAQKTPTNGARIAHFEIVGPYNHVTGPSPAARKLYTCGHMNGGHEAWCARRIVSSFARRAFRRPVRAAEVDRFASLIAAHHQTGDSFEEGLSVALHAILVSPDFLFRLEGAQPTAGGSAIQPVGSYALASRLSVLPLVQHAGRCPDARRRVGDAAAAGGAGGAGPPHAEGSQSRRARRKLRRAVAAVPRARVERAGSRALP